jgi:hypothetical protein
MGPTVMSPCLPELGDYGDTSSFNPGHYLSIYKHLKICNNNKEAYLKKQTNKIHIFA